MNKRFIGLVILLLIILGGFIVVAAPKQGLQKKVSQNKNICKDSDGGPKIFIKGNATAGNIFIEDTCNLKVFNGENYQYNLVLNCTGKNCFVNEAMCKKNLITDGVRGIGQKLFKCPKKGCSNGACIK